MRWMLAAAMAALIGSAEAQTARFADDPYHHFFDESAREMRASCEAYLGPQVHYEDTVTAMNCANGVIHYLFNTGKWRPDQLEESIATHCGARLVLNHKDEDLTVAQILEAEYDKSCSEPGLM